MAGLGWDAQIMPVKVLDSQGAGNVLTVAEGIIWAVDRGARVVNVSLGGESYSETVRSATDYAYSRGVLVVAAAGNCGDPISYSQGGCSTHNPTIYPAANPNVLAVAATDMYNAHASFSSYGYYVDVAAPGDFILSTYWAGGSDYTFLSGTSMASPLVAGLASLVWGRDPGLSSAQVASLIVGTAIDLGAPGRDDYFGSGLVDASLAVRIAAVAQSTAPAESQSAFAPSSASANAPVRPGAVLVKFKAGTTEASRQASLKALGAAAARELPSLGVLELRVPAGKEREVAGQLANNPAVEFAEPNYLVRAY